MTLGLKSEDIFPVASVAENLSTTADISAAVLSVSAIKASNSGSPVVSAVTPAGDTPAASKAGSKEPGSNLVSSAVLKAVSAFRLSSTVTKSGS